MGCSLEGTPNRLTCINQTLVLIEALFPTSEPLLLSLLESVLEELWSDLNLLEVMELKLLETLEPESKLKFVDPVEFESTVQ